MELSEESEQSTNELVDVTPAQTTAPSPASSTGTTTPSYVYALGRVTSRFPSLEDYAKPHSVGNRGNSFLTY